MYSVEVYANGRSHFVERRYRDFHELHCELKRDVESSSLPDFPPKKLRNLSPKVIEERRLLLEKYLQCVASYSLIHPSLQTFLGLTNDSMIAKTSFQNEDDFRKDELSHEPVIGFASEDEARCDSGLIKAESDKDMLLSNRDFILPDIVLKGALEALYSRSDDD